MIGTIFVIFILFWMIVISGNRYHQHQQTRAIVRAIQGPRRIAINQGGWKDPLLRKFLFAMAMLILFVIIAAVASH